jgi:hypothetical protein
MRSVQSAMVRQRRLLPQLRHGLGEPPQYISSSAQFTSEEPSVGHSRFGAAHPADEKKLVNDFYGAWRNFLVAVTFPKGQLLEGSGVR